MSTSKTSSGKAKAPVKAKGGGGGGGGKSPAKSAYRYRLRFMPEALAEWQQLDGSIRTPLKKLLAKRLDSPHVPGGALHGPLAGCYKIKLRKQGVRLVYAVDDDPAVLTVLVVDKREAGAAYESAMARLAGAAPREASRKPQK